MTAKLICGIDLIAVEPFENKGPETKISDGLAMLAGKNTLLRTKVVFGLGVEAGSWGMVVPGNYVYFSRDVMQQAWAKTVVEVSGQNVILVPRQAIKLIEQA